MECGCDAVGHSRATKKKNWSQRFSAESLDLIMLIISAFKMELSAASSHSANVSVRAGHIGVVPSNNRDDVLEKTWARLRSQSSRFARSLVYVGAPKSPFRATSFNRTRSSSEASREARRTSRSSSELGLGIRLVCSRVSVNLASKPNILDECGNANQPDAFPGPNSNGPAESTIRNRPVQYPSTSESPRLTSKLILSLSVMYSGDSSREVMERSPSWHSGSWLSNVYDRLIQSKKKCSYPA
jgi:hypothetical protein